MREFSYMIDKLGRRVSHSMRLMIIVSLHIVIIAINGYITYYGVKQMEFDAQIINQSGVIRGAVQKSCKLETNYENADKDMAKVDEMFRIMLDENSPYLLERNLHAFVEQLKLLHLEWIELQRAIMLHRESPTDVNHELILSLSEKFWIHANQTVYLAQALSENKLSTFQIMFVVFFFDFVLIVGIIWLINSIVRHNLEVHSRIDPLTGVYNRNVYNEEIYSEITRSKRYGYGFSLLLFDIDFFKAVNDEFGHDKGDEVLKTVCDVVASRIRKSDLLCRLGGEEFAIITTETAIEGATKLGETIRKAVADYDYGLNRAVTISIGVSEWSIDDNKDTLFKRVDKALYQAKNEGRNRVVVL
jgi:diguanylate cyclase (GGDEF)-like protein